MIMISELRELENVFVQSNIGIVYNLLPDKEADAYCGYNFQINQWQCKFRKAKTTPKKVGQFVTLWRRNEDGVTEPFNENDNDDFYIIFTEERDKRGIFLFSKTVLIQKQILSTSTKEGKRGFRVYPIWSQPENLQAKNTQSWQSKYFVELSNSESTYKDNMDLIFSLLK